MVAQALEHIDLPYLSVSADAVDPRNGAWISQTWQAARARMSFGNFKEFLLIIDEVHKINNWSEYVKKEWDQDTLQNRNIKVVLLGSSRLLLKDGLTESLAGRYELIRMPHWSYTEMSDAFGLSLNEFIYFGGYPAGAKLLSDEGRWRRYLKDSIIDPAISKDVLMTKTIYKPNLMKQLFDLGCSYSGKEISLTKILGALTDAGNVTTISGYLNTLGESQLLCGLQKYANDNARKYNSSPKLMVFNTALLSALSRTSYQKAYEEPMCWGRWVESAVGAHLLNMAEELDYRVYYWREKSDEVDFIVQGARHLLALEVKSGSKSSTSGLSLFSQKFTPDYSLIVGTGGIPLEEFLSSDLSGLL